MNIETMIYSYIIICIGLGIFNIAAYFIRSVKRRRIMHRGRGLTRYVRKVLLEIQENESLQNLPLVRKELLNWMKKTNGLMAFEQVIEQLRVPYPEEVTQLLAHLRPVFSELCGIYSKKGDMATAHFVYVMSGYFPDMGPVPQPILDCLLALVRSKSIYCRQNALEALYSLGDAQLVAEAMHILNESHPTYDAKLVTDGLATFTGDPYSLSQLLWPQYAEYSTTMRIAFINYLRLRDGNWCEEVFQEFCNKELHHEIRYACMRYFGKYAYEPAREPIMQMLDGADTNWEYAAIAANVLANYPGERTVQLLKKALHRPEWYVRFNAATSLERLQVGYMELNDILNGSDRYAREILQYRLQLTQIAGDTPVVVAINPQQEQTAGQELPILGDGNAYCKKEVEFA